jgi:hypothetical protein
MLLKDISDNPRYTAEEKTLCAALKNGPLTLRETAESVPGKDIYTYNVSRLLKEGVIIGIGLTPTDIMHIKGDFVRYSTEASLLGAEYAAMNLDITVNELCDRIYGEIKRKLYINIVKALLENKGDQSRQGGIGKDVERLINDKYLSAASGKKNDFFTLDIKTDFILAGVGAPIRIFLHDVANTLGTKAVIPEHFEVANALGAIAGSVSASTTVDIRPNYAASGITGYTVSGRDETKVFDYIRNAEEYAAAEAEAGALAEATRRGARGEINVTCKLIADEADTGEFRVYLGTRAVALAVGSAGLGGG